MNSPAVEDLERFVDPLRLQVGPPTDRRFIFAGLGDAVITPDRTRSTCGNTGAVPTSSHIPAAMSAICGLGKFTPSWIKPSPNCQPRDGSSRLGEFAPATPHAAA